MGSALMLAGAASASPLGKYQPYEGVWDSTVALWDAGFAPLEEIPAHNAVLPNLMRERMAEITGLSLADCDFTIDNTLSAGFAAAEVTEKGGLHVASTQAGEQNAICNFGALYSQPFAEWLMGQTDAGADYGVLFTLWHRPTRALVTAGNTAPQSLAHLCNTTTPSINRLYVMQNGSGLLPGSALIAGQTHNALDMPGVSAVGSQGWSGAKPANFSLRSGRVFFNGGAQGGWATSNYNKAGSGIFYRAQLDLVDLSEIAGATLADKASAMLAAINTLAARDFAEGGRFHGDEFTPAATLKP
ncbi:hypothetical protein H0274_01695 [Altererythrobacter sp. CC-YST694]|uniref:hypothetical protein n=1 Tax=Altererythrobacter sp. CC-YST694 TaxID=2755038 RepID=UPI001D00E14B|nr:hypothetical protein [Altererythrobacter sp. CC-YST694]MCB5423958.1 hypothetical protein [Altererythrobacter sp. CC-YST694]